MRRHATRDVDSASRLDAVATAAVARVASRRGLPDRWLNDNAAMFWPANADMVDYAVAYEAGGLTVKIPPPETIFVMKLYRADPQDHEDMVAIWQTCGFASPADAGAAFRRAYPHAPDDEYLVDYITGIADESRR